MRIKFIKRYEGFTSGMSAELPRLLARKLIKRGYAIISKDMTPDDYRQAGENHGRPS